MVTFIMKRFAFMYFFPFRLLCILHFRSGRPPVVEFVPRSRRISIDLWSMRAEAHRTRRHEIIFCLRLLASSYSPSHFDHSCTMHMLTPYRSVFGFDSIRLFQLLSKHTPHRQHCQINKYENQSTKSQHCIKRCVLRIQSPCAGPSYAAGEAKGHLEKVRFELSVAAVFYISKSHAMEYLHEIIKYNYLYCYRRWTVDDIKSDNYFSHRK